MKKCLFSIYVDVVWCPTWSENLGRYVAYLQKTRKSIWSIINVILFYYSVQKNKREKILGRQPTSALPQLRKSLSSSILGENSFWQIQYKLSYPKFEKMALQFLPILDCFIDCCSGSKHQYPIKKWQKVGCHIFSFGYDGWYRL